jgi:hypothetical protein
MAGSKRSRLAVGVMMETSGDMAGFRALKGALSTKLGGGRGALAAAA